MRARWVEIGNPREKFQALKHGTITNAIVNTKYMMPVEDVRDAREGLVVADEEVVVLIWAAFEQREL